MVTLYLNHHRTLNFATSGLWTWVMQVLWVVLLIILHHDLKTRKAVLTYFAHVESNSPFSR